MEKVMERTATQVIRQLEARVAHLEKSAGGTNIYVTETRSESNYGTYEVTNTDNTKMSPEKLFSRLNELSNVSMQRSRAGLTFSGRTHSDKIVEFTVVERILLDALLKDYFLKGVL